MNLWKETHQLTIQLKTIFNMCLITVCPCGTSKKREDLENFIKNGLGGNSDGAGIAIKYADKDGLYFKKGFTNYDDMADYIEGMSLKDQDILMLHYRIGTQGATNSFNTHPFIISQDISEMCVTEGITDKPLLMHNGIFYGEFSGPAFNSCYFSDTFYIATDFLAIPEVLALLKRDIHLFCKLYKDILAKNKIVVLFPDSNAIRSIGDFIRVNGYAHSNQGYCRTDYRNVGGTESYLGLPIKSESAYKQFPEYNTAGVNIVRFGDPLQNYSILPYGETYMPITSYNMSLMWLTPMFNRSSDFPKVLEYGKYYTIEDAFNNGTRLHLRKDGDTNIISIDNHNQIIQRGCIIAIKTGLPRSEEVVDYRALYNKFTPTKSAIMRACTMLSAAHGKRFVMIEGSKYLTAAALMYFHDIAHLCVDHRIHDVLCNPKEWIAESRLSKEMIAL